MAMLLGLPLNVISDFVYHEDCAAGRHALPLSILKHDFPIFHGKI